jgi:AmiR/NasT family two-component response regulator
VVPATTPTKSWSRKEKLLAERLRQSCGRLYSLRMGGQLSCAVVRLRTLRRMRAAADQRTQHLRVLIANERSDRLALVAAAVVALGHDVIAREIDIEDVGPATARERPDVALVGLGASSMHALGLIDKIVHEAECPVIVLLHAPDPEFVKEASKRGVFAHINDNDVMIGRVRSTSCCAEYQNLQGAFGRRATTERAKGILMERHSVSEAVAFEMLRDHSRTSNRKLIDLATAVVDGHQLLPKQPADAAGS